jgi:hypothetical protein
LLAYLRDARYARIVIVAHSQGTVISADQRYLHVQAGWGHRRRTARRARLWARRCATYARPLLWWIARRASSRAGGADLG